MDNVYVASGGTAVIVSVLFQIVKNSTWFPWLTRETGKLNAAIGVLIALVSALGIVWSFDFNPNSYDFTGQFHGNLLDVWHAIEHSFVQWVMQHTFYKTALVPAEALGEIRGLLARGFTPPPISDGAAKAEKG